ncbi:uncharacterized protein LOC123693257 [Colias croceus]|uniref:uncharacterized protein LOC123693257 n=1 Tax=Colias crocea TaxID=72248 RepID=UPI001E280776|nr:uncharacterized protein LOC123693257 [Colias croceus]
MNGSDVIDEHMMEQSADTNLKSMPYIQRRQTKNYVTKGNNESIVALKGTEHLFAITESGCSPSIQDREIIPPGYQILRCDRNDGRKQGGVFLVATQRLELREVRAPGVAIDSCVFEMVCATVHLGRQLDLVLCSGFSDGIEVVAADEVLVPADAYHPPLTVRLRARASPASAAAAPTTQAASAGFTNDRLQWNFYKADFQLMYALLTSTEWDPLYKMEGVEQALDFFYAKVYDIFDRCVPKKKQLKTNMRYKYPEWYTKNIIHDIKVKARLHRKYKISKLKTDYDAFAAYRSRIKTAIETAHKLHRDKIQKQFKRDPKSLWQYIRSKRGTPNQPVIIEDNKHLDDGECAAQFAKFFESVYSSVPPRLDAKAAAAAAAAATSGVSCARVHVEAFSQKEVSDALKHLKPKHSAGPDGIPAFLVKDCSRVLVEPLLYIFNICLKSATFPVRWKITRVIPVPKNKTGSSVRDYRPVAVLSTPAKVFEAALHSRIQQQIRPMLSDEQHGFRSACSTATNLLSFMTQLIPAVDAGGQVDVAYFDFRKAFDTVDNDILLKKFAEVGYTPKLLEFFASYMRDRQQYVDYKGFLSEPYYTWSGVSQGTLRRQSGNSRQVSVECSQFYSLWILTCDRTLQPKQLQFDSA